MIKLQSKLITINEAIVGLEKIKASTKPKTKLDTGDFAYSELPPSFYKPLGNSELSKWDNEYSILSTDKWQVPMPRPPVCINNSPCKVCPSVADSYPVNLQDWDSSRKVSNIAINKDWVEKQTVNPNSPPLSQNQPAPLMAAYPSPAPPMA